MAVSYSQYIDYLFYRSHGSGIPLSGTFELTSRCNLDCKMCYIHKRANDRKVLSEELSTEQWLDFAKQAQKEGTLLLLLTGGEPLLRHDFKEIYTGCRKLGLLMSINTNGTLMTDEMVEFLKKDAPLRVNITLYGASAETYERLCGDPTAFERAYKAVLALKKAGIRVKLNYSATPYNYKDLPEVYAFARENDLMIQTASYMFPPVRACEHCAEEMSERLTPAQSAMARFGYELYQANGSDDALEQKLKAMMEGRQIEDIDHECFDLPTERIRCRAGDTTFWVTYKGEMRPCGMMTVPTTDMVSKGFAEAWQEIREARQKIMVPAKCTECTWKHACEVCPAVCYGETGAFDQAPEYVCEKTRNYLQLAVNWLNSRGNQNGSK